MNNAQLGILANESSIARYLTFSLSSPSCVIPCLKKLQIHNDNMVIGFGASLLKHLDVSIPGLSNFPVYSGAGFDVPSTPAALWIWLRGDDRGELLHKTLEIQQLLSDSFSLQHAIDAFQYQGCRDLSGYVDGTENPTDDEAFQAAIVQQQGEGLDGSSFVAVQQWVHQLDHFKSLPVHQQDDIIGRHVSNNEEFDEAPASAHVKRTAQESFSPEAFIVRRSMPWNDAHNAGLVFVAFGHSVDAFDALLRKMVGEDDGIVDGLFQFTQPVTGAYFWCPPVADEKLDLRALGF